MKTFIKLLVSFIAGFITCFGFIAWAFRELQEKPENHLEACDKVADWVRNMGYDVRDPEEEEQNFKMGFH